MNTTLMERDTLTKHKAFWRGQLRGELPELPLPFDYPRTESCMYESFQYVISRHACKKMKTFSQKKKINPSIILLAVFKLLLYRYSHEKDIRIGTLVPEANHRDPPLSSANIIILRTLLEDHWTFNSLLHEVKRLNTEAREHGIPFKELMKEFHNDPTKLFTVMVDMQKSLVNTHFDYRKLNVDIFLRVRDVKNELLVEWIYNKTVFKHETIVRMSGHFTRLLESGTDRPDQPISHIPIMSEQEIHQLLVEWNPTSSNYPRHVSVPEIFEDQVKNYPDHIALVIGNSRITYKQLNERANQLARYLESLDLQNEQLVAICLPRSEDLIASMLAILKAGGAYVPIDIGYPKERIAYMLEDSGAAFVITTESVARQLPPIRSKVILLEKADHIMSALPKNNAQTRIHIDRLAYVIYTSGSTGRPKGVQINQRGIIRLVKNITYAEVGHEQVILNRAPVAFDASVFEIYGSLLNGGTLVMMTSPKPSFKEIAKTIKENNVTTLRATPSILNVLLEDYHEDMTGLKQVISSGEALPVWLAEKCLSALKNAKLINAYGPTENSVSTTSYLVEKLTPNTSVIPIGRPIAGDKVYILDKHFQPVPIGVIGELFLTGDGIARGYLNRPDLTNEKFIPNPFNNDEKLYRSGDLGRYRPDGNIEYIGRSDDQVKVRGYRIELGEVETAIGLYPGVRQAAAKAINGKDGNKDLAAYVVMNKGVKFDSRHIRNFLKEQLPEQMIPTFITELNEIPSTPTGKTDRRNLPDPVLSITNSEIVAPRNQIEEKLVTIWENLLNVKPISVTESYYNLGGTSLLAMQMFSVIEKEFNKDLPVSLIFQEDTIEKLAKRISQTIQNQPDENTLVPIQPLGANTPLFCIHGGGGEVLVYRELAVKMGVNQPLYGLRFAGFDNTETLSIELLAEKYIKELKTVQPKGPYHIFGYCFGGIIAYEMAQQLIKDGQEVALLTILNFSNPKKQPIELSNQINYRKVIKNNLKLLFNMPLKQRVAFFIQKSKNALKLAKTVPESNRTMDGFKKTRDILARAINNYKPKPYAGNILLMRGNRYLEDEKYLGWKVTDEGSIEEYFIPEEHERLLKDPSVNTVVKLLKNHI